MIPSNVLLEVLRDPARLASLAEDDWDLLLRMARANRLIARLEFLLGEQGAWESAPQRARDNIRGALAHVQYLQLQIRRELMDVRKVLRGVEAPLVLLKGAAYLEAGLPCSQGRSLSDLDLLVRREDLPLVEKTLNEAGWESDTEEDYDQRYYREWMHEIPPLKHRFRGVEVDIHHNLLALTGRYRVPAEKLWEQARPLEEKGLRVLAPADMLLHSAAHLLVSDELRGGLRDLFDIHQLYNHFCRTEADFPQALLARSHELNLSRPLFYALDTARELLHTPLAPMLRDRRNFDLPNRTGQKLMAHLIREVLRPRLPGESPPAFRQWLLYVRSHWIRMPPGLLLSHLTRKSLRRFGKTSAKSA
ncbi:MAG: hypothetical protein DSZ02_00720 [Gammaproteobacteria bacterium]|nr:MAG: hypothetical protein DSZ02_00720 [Gammaproteobacteria bacterium]